MRLKIILLLVKFYIKKSLCPSVFFVIANEVCRRFFFAFLFKCEQVFSVPALPLISVGDNDGASVRLQLQNDRFKFFLNFLLFSLTIFLYDRTRKAPWIHRKRTEWSVGGGSRKLFAVTSRSEARRLWCFRDFLVECFIWTATVTVLNFACFRRYSFSEESSSYFTAAHAEYN